MNHFRYDARGQLCAEGVELARIAADVSTPTFVYSRATIERHFRVFDESFDGHPHLVCYSVKANSNAAVLRLLANLGAGADVVSGGELVRALRAGILPDRIVFSGVAKSRAEMALALDAQIAAFNVESEAEIDALERVASERGTVAPVALRVNPDIDAKTHPHIATGLADSKFGVPASDVPRLAARIASTTSLALVGIDCHIGSQMTSVAPLLASLDAILALVDALEAEGIVVGHVDLGGGLGIQYIPDIEPPPYPGVLGTAVVERMRGRTQRLILEPGRVIVGNAGMLLARVVYVKKTSTKTFIVVDAGMNDLVRPALYGAHHEILPVLRDDARETFAVDVVGPVCETSDVFAKGRGLPELREGELVAIASAGAYGFAMSSNYNSRPRAAEVLVDGERWHVVRERETVESLMTGESIPSWLRGEDS